MSFFRRLRLYAVGFLLGCFLVSFLFKGRSCRLPGTLKMEELRLQKRQFSNSGVCAMKCRNISEEEISEILKDGKVNHDKSDVHALPFPTYIVEGKTKKNRSLRL